MGMTDKPFKYEHYLPDKDLVANIMVTSFQHSLSVNTELITAWFLEQMPENFYKTIHNEGEHPIYDFKKYKKHDAKMKRPKPSLTIMTNVVYDYDRDMHDLHPGGLTFAHFPGYDRHSFYKDFEKDTYMATQMGELNVEYTFLTRVESRAWQIDLFNYMNKSFGIGFVSKFYIDIDYLLPKQMMHVIAYENGFKFGEDGEVEDLIGFLNLLNKRSEYPIRYKLRGVNRKKDYFLRYMDCVFNIDHTEKLSINEGDTIGDLKDNFDIEMRISTKLPIPKIFALFNRHKYNISEMGNPHEEQISWQLQICEAPQINSKGWNQYLVTEYYKDFNPSEDKFEAIDFRELLVDLRIADIVDNNTASGISSDIFIDFNLKNSDKEIKYTVDWDKCIINTEECLIAERTLITVFIDTVYLSEQRELIDKISESRTKKV